MPVTKGEVIVTALRYPRLLTTNRDKVIDQRDKQNPVRMVILGQEHTSQKVIGLNPGKKNLIKYLVYLYDHNTVEFIHSTCER